MGEEMLSKRQRNNVRLFILQLRINRSWLNVMKLAIANRAINFINKSFLNKTIVYLLIVHV